MSTALKCPTCSGSGLAPEGNTLGERVRLLRAASGKTGRQIPGISAAVVSRIEQGKIMPGAEKLVALADAFGVSTDYLLCRPGAQA